MAVDQFPQQQDHVTAPARIATAVIPSDTVALATLPKRLYVGVGGMVALRPVDGTGDVTYMVPSGTYLQVRASYVRATGTTATNIIAES